MIYIVDYQSGNLGAIVNMMKKIGAKAEIASTPDQLLGATKIILPGVGTFDTGMQNLMAGGWLQVLNQKVLTEKIPTLGICLGMQLITESSEEGKLKGLGWVKGLTKKFAFENNKEFKVPHMGWNKVSVCKHSKLITAQSGEEKRFYFAHAYYVTIANQDEELLSTSYGVPFTSGIEKDNILGVQFHPEKSHRFGMELLRNFINNY
jgi:glutamine amidotransferase